jgi:glycosyltransferase involved in cell wall biosynthesis
MVKRGLGVSVIQFGTEVSEEERDAVRLVTLPRCRKFPGSWLLDRWRLRSYLQSQSGKADIVEVPDFDGWLPLRVVGSKVVARLHQTSTALTFNNGRQPRLSLRWRESRTLAKADGWIGVSQHSIRGTRRLFPSLPCKRERVIFSPLLVERPAATSPRQRFVLFAGYVSRSKGADRLARVMKPVMERFPDVKLVYAGRILPFDETRDTREVIQEELGGALAARCEFPGFVARRDLHEMMCRAACFAFPSLLETFGLVVGEAMRLGCPVVVPDEPPFDEYIEHGVTGIRCRTDEQWTAEIIRLLECPDAAVELGERGRQFADAAFSLERCVDETLAFYKELLQVPGVA